MKYNLGALLSLLVAFQLLFVALYLITHKKENKKSNWLLALLFLMFSINLLDFAARVSGLFFRNPFLHLLDDAFFLLYGPVLYGYTKTIAYHDFHLRKKHLWHLIPFIIFIFYVVFLITTVNLETNPAIATKISEADFPTWVYVINLIVYLQIFTYLWLSWKTIKTYRSVIKDRFSSIEGINLNWLNFIIRAFFGITIVAMIHNLMPVAGNMMFLYVSVMILLLISFFFINLVLVKALNQPAIFSGITQAETTKYALSKLSFEELHSYKTKLSLLMQNDRLYLNPELHSKELAQHMGISTKLLSQVINQGFGKNFFDYINYFRCQEVKRILQGPDKKMTIIEAMYQAGFNSKSSFNKEFKKLMGITPSEYKKQLLRS